jgi:hypothetical protein
MKKASCAGMEDVLFEDLFPGGDLFMSQKSHSTRESLSGMSKGILSEEEVHESLFRSVGSNISLHDDKIMAQEAFNEGEIHKILKRD